MIRGLIAAFELCFLSSRGKRSSQGLIEAFEKEYDEFDNLMRAFIPLNPLGHQYALADSTSALIIGREEHPPDLEGRRIPAVSLNALLFWISLPFIFVESECIHSDEKLKTMWALFPASTSSV
jgi:hypothetical protein